MMFLEHTAIEQVTISKHMLWYQQCRFWSKLYT